MLKKFVFIIGAALFALLGLPVLFPATISSVSAHHTSVNQSANCDGWLVSATFTGPGTRRVEWNVTITVDGVEETLSDDQLMSGFETIFTRSGGSANSVQATGYVKMYSQNRGGQWTHLEDNDSVSLNFQGECVEVTPEPTPEVTPESVKVALCHATGSANNPYTSNEVSIHSVNDANGLNGHGQHTGDIWSAFTFDGVNYPGQGDQTLLPDCIVPEVTDEPEETPEVTVTVTVTPRPTVTATVTTTPQTPYNLCEIEGFDVNAGLSGDGISWDTERQNWTKSPFYGDPFSVTDGSGNTFDLAVVNSDGWRCIVQPKPEVVVTTTPTETVCADCAPSQCEVLPEIGAVVIPYYSSSVAETVTMIVFHNVDLGALRVEFHQPTGEQVIIEELPDHQIVDGLQNGYTIQQGNELITLQEIVDSADGDLNIYDEQCSRCAAGYQLLPSTESDGVYIRYGEGDTRSELALLISSRYNLSYETSFEVATFVAATWYGYQQVEGRENHLWVLVEMPESTPEESAAAEQLRLYHPELTR